MAKTADANHLPKRSKKSSLTNCCLIAIMISFSITCIVLAFYFHIRNNQGFFPSTNSVPRVVVKRNRPSLSKNDHLQQHSNSTNTTKVTNTIVSHERHFKLVLDQNNKSLGNIILLLAKKRDNNLQESSSPLITIQGDLVSEQKSTNNATFLPKLTHSDVTI